MKISGAKKVHYDSGPNMTPLVDVVMVILIFLMLAGSFGGTTHYLMSQAGVIKGGSKGAPLKAGQVPDENLEIHVDNNHSGPGFVAEGTGIRPTNDAVKLAADLKRKLIEYEATGGDSKAEHIQVVLYPTKTVRYEYLIQVYQAALQANFTKVAFATSH